MNDAFLYSFQLLSLFYCQRSPKVGHKLHNILELVAKYLVAYRLKFAATNGEFLPRNASAERGDEIACRLSVCPSVRNVQVP